MADSINSDNGKCTIEIDMGRNLDPPQPDKVLISVIARVHFKSPSSPELPSGCDAFSHGSPSGYILAHWAGQSFRVPYEDFSSDQQYRRRIAAAILELADIPFRLEDQQVEFSVSRGKAKLLKSFQEVVTGLDAVLQGLSPESILNWTVFLRITKILNLPEKEFEEWNIYRHNHTAAYNNKVIILPLSRIRRRILALSVLDRPGEGELCCGVAANGCPICLEDVKPARLIKLPCGHIYHQHCILMWIDNNRSCPYCRAETPEIPALDTVGIVLLTRHKRREYSAFQILIPDGDISPT